MPPLLGNTDLLCLAARFLGNGEVKGRTDGSTDVGDDFQLLPPPPPRLCLPLREPRFVVGPTTEDINSSPAMSSEHRSEIGYIVFALFAKVNGTNSKIDDYQWLTELSDENNMVA